MGHVGGDGMPAQQHCPADSGYCSSERPSPSSAASAMSDDFVRLVNQSNPASASASGYPPSANPYSSADPNLLDPFFDDDDDRDGPDSAFGPIPPMRSTSSGLPLTRDPAPLAGQSKISLPSDGVPQGWTFDDDDPAFPAHSSQSHRPPPPKSPHRAPRLKWSWPWRKERVLTGERVIALNTPDANNDFPSNYVSTTKYNLLTFVPKFIFGQPPSLPSPHIPSLTLSPAEQFSKYANLFFLFTACIQQIPGVSPTNKWTTIAPLSVVLLASAFKEGQEDLVSPRAFSPPVPLIPAQKRHQSDSELNARKAKVLTQAAAFDSKKWKDIRVGDLVRVENNDFIPADLILISSSEPEGLCFIETSNLDGCAPALSVPCTCLTTFPSETNLKIKQASPHTASLTAPHLVTALRGSLRSEHPNNSLYTYEGTLDLTTAQGFPKQVPLGPDQMLLRGAQIRNTPWAYGLVVFTGHETKLMRNAT